MNQEEFEQGLTALDVLSQGDYNSSIWEVASPNDPDQAIARLSRLIGVTLKQPFAKEVDLATPSLHTGAYRGWDLVPEYFADPAKRLSWQFRTLEAIRKEDALGRGLQSVEALAQEAQYERGFFGFLAASACKYICGDTELRKKIDASVAEAKAAGYVTKPMRPETLVQAGGLALGSILISRIPVLGQVGAPVIAGFVLVLYTVGANAFCAYVDAYWSDKER